MAVDYGVGRGNIGQLYTNLQNAVASEGEAENQREARDIERKGLFGSGIKQSDIQDFGNLAIKGAALGDARMERKMDRATKSFERRVKADERRIASLKERAKVTGSKEAYEKLMGQIQGIEMGMGERRNSFEDYMGKYQEKGLWGTSFGGDDVGYRTEGRSKWSKDTEPGPKPEGKRIGSREDMPVGWSPDVVPEWRRDKEESGSGLPPMRDFERSASQPGGPEFRGGTNIQENAPPEFQRSTPEAYLRDDITRSPSQPDIGRSGRRSPSVQEFAPPEFQEPPPEAFLKDDIATRSNKFEEGMMNTKRSGPVQDNAPYETFKNAFRNARRQRGAGGTFDWRGNEYTTDYK